MQDSRLPRSLRVTVLVLAAAGVGSFLLLGHRDVPDEPRSCHSERFVDGTRVGDGLTGDLYIWCARRGWIGHVIQDSVEVELFDPVKAPDR